MQTNLNALRNGMKHNQRDILHLVCVVERRIVLDTRSHYFIGTAIYGDRGLLRSSSLYLDSMVLVSNFISISVTNNEKKRLFLYWKLHMCYVYWCSVHQCTLLSSRVRPNRQWMSNSNDTLGLCLQTKSSQWIYTQSCYLAPTIR